MKVVIADDHALVREGTIHLIKGCESVGDVFAADSHASLLNLLETHPDMGLIILDINMAEVTTAEMITTLKDRHPTTLIAVISVLEDSGLARDLLINGASGYIPKSSSNQIFLNAVRLIIGGGTYIPPFMLEGIPWGKCCSSVSGMTPRQQTILALISKGYTNKRIAEDLYLSVSTVKAHVSAIIAFLGVENRTQAANEAIKLGLVEG